MEIYRIVNVLFQVYSALILVRVFLSYFRHNPYHPLIRFIYEVTEPWLGLFRRVIPPVGRIDFSPIAALFVLELLRQLIITILFRVGFGI